MECPIGLDKIHCQNCYFMCKVCGACLMAWHETGLGSHKHFTQKGEKIFELDNKEVE